MKQMNSFFRMSCLAVAALAITASCSNEELDGVNGLSKANTFITATFEQPDGGIKTRTTLGDGNKVLWQSGDQFKLFYGSSDAVFKTEGSGESVTFGANISGDISGATYAIFPIMTDVNVTLSGKTATTILRKEIPFSEATNGPMWADASADYTNLSFKHLAGLLKLTVSGLSVSDGETLTLKINADKKIAGAAKVDFSASGEPFLAVAESGDDVFDEIKVTNVKPVAGQATVFYVPLPVKTLGELKVNIYNSKDTTTPLYKEKKWTNVAVARAMIRSASFGFEVVDVNETGSKTISEAIKDAMPSETATTATTTTVEIKGRIDATTGSDQNATIAVPAEENKNVALDFGAAPTTSAEKPLIITEATSSGSGSGTTPAEDSKNTITVTMPAATTAVAAVTIETPQSTVELTSPSETTSSTTKYTTITATTANNTLVVGKNVEIETINVKGGNIRLKAGSKVGSITNSTSGTIIVYMETGAALTTTPTEESKIEVRNTDQDANLEAVLAKGGTYILPAELKLTKPLDVYGEVTFDLNGYKVTYADGFSGGALFLVHRGGKLIVNDSRGGGSIDSYDSNLISGILLTAKSDETNTAIQSKNAIVEINAGTIKGNDYAVVGQGTRHGTQITINGGTLESKVGAGIYHPQDGTLTIKGGTITGKETGVELRSGKLIITGGTFTSTAESATCAANGSGTTTAGAALAVVQHTTKKAIDVTISGGTFNGVYSLFQKDIQNNNPDNVTMSVTGGTFNGEVYSQNCANFITGGTFKNFEVATQRVTVSDADAFVMALSNRAAANITVANSINLSDRTIEELTLKEHKGININENVTIQLGNKNRIEANQGLSLTGSGKIDNTSSDHSNLGQGWQKSLIHLLGGETIIDGITMVNDMSYHWHGDSNLGRPYNSACVSYWSDAKITVQNAKFYSGGFTICGMGRSDNSALVTLINSYFESNSSNKDNGIAWSYAMRLFGNQINIDQCEVKGVQGGIAVELCQNATIKSGKFYTVNSGENTDAYYPLYVSNSGIVTIEGGDFIGANSWSNLAEGKSAVVASDNDQGWPTGSVILKGGRFNGKAYNSISHITYNPADGYEWKAISDDPNLIWEVVKSSNE